MEFSLDDLKNRKGLQKQTSSNGSSSLSTNNAAKKLANLKTGLQNSQSINKPNIEKKINSLAASVAKEASIELKNTAAELIFIIDKSSSTHSLAPATIKGMNDLLMEQKRTGYKTKVTIIFFDGEFEVLCQRTDIDRLPNISYNADGNKTAIWDALVKNLSECKTRQMEAKDISPEKTIVTIMTDGMDNASRCNYVNARDIINSCKRLGWKFIFLGANIDAKYVASMIGIDPHLAENYQNSVRGALANFKAVSAALNGFRETGQVNKNWADIIKKTNNMQQINGNEDTSPLGLTDGRRK